jgi:hypothetical protein
MFWIEAQSATAIAVFVFGLTYVLAATVFCLARILSRRSVAQDLKAVVPVTLMTPLGVILGLLIAFLAARVWTNLEHANQYVGQEAGALRETVLLADALPPDVRTKVRQAVQRHLRLIESEEWPAMARGQATLQSIAVGLAEAMTELLSFAPTHERGRWRQQPNILGGLFDPNWRPTLSISVRRS